MRKIRIFQNNNKLSVKHKCVFLFKATYFGQDIDHHQAKYYTVITRQLQ